MSGFPQRANINEIIATTIKSRSGKNKKVSELLTESIATLGENITISRYVRFAVGESDILNNKISIFFLWINNDFLNDHAEYLYFAKYKISIKYRN